MKKYKLGVFFFFIVFLCGAILINKSFKKPLTYINTIDKVYNSNISGMVVGITKASNFYRNNEQVLLSVGGNKENNFSASSKEGVKLWEAKQLFLSIKNLKVLRKGLPEMLVQQDIEYYLILANHDYYGRDAKLNIHYCQLYVNTKNYHIFMPKDYYEPDKLQNLSVEYIEYEPNEITKKLVNDIVAIN